jgi:exodeoxyribonuclease VII small subunit
VSDQPGSEQPDLAAMSYEQAREELVDVVRTLEAGGTTLEESLALWERGEALAARCQSWLDGARERLDSAVAKDQQPHDGDENTTED